MGGCNFLFIFSPTSPISAKQTAKSTAQHELVVMLMPTQLSPSGGRLDDEAEVRIVLDSKHVPFPLQNLVDFVDRVKEKYWSDWEEEQAKDPPPKEEKKKDEADGKKEEDKEEKKEDGENKDKEDGKEEEEKK